MRERRRLFVLSGISLGGAAVLGSRAAVAIVPSNAANQDANSAAEQSRLIVHNSSQIGANHARGMILNIPTSGTASMEPSMSLASYLTPAAGPVSTPEQFLGGEAVTTLITNNDISSENSTADSSFKGESFYVADGMKNAQFDAGDVLASRELERLGSQFKNQIAPDRSTRFDASRNNPDQAVNEHWSGVAPTPTDDSEAGKPIIR
jgi:hypothetical protein